MVDTKPRKKPRQTRSRVMADNIVEASARVLSERGAAGFTTNHVAERAGVSIGSLYQYFPNKAALLMAVLERENAGTLAALDEVLGNSKLTAEERIRVAIERFLATEAGESKLRRALQQAEAYFGAELDSRAVARRRIHTFLLETGLLADPHDPFPADLLTTAVASIAEEVTNRDSVDLDRWARSLADMLLLWLRSQSQSSAA